MIVSNSCSITRLCDSFAQKTAVNSQTATYFATIAYINSDKDLASWVRKW